MSAGSADGASDERGERAVSFSPKAKENRRQGRTFAGAGLTAGALSEAITFQRSVPMSDMYQGNSLFKRTCKGSRPPINSQNARTHESRKFMSSARR